MELFLVLTGYEESRAESGGGKERDRRLKSDEVQVSWVLKLFEEQNRIASNLIKIPI